MNHINPKIKKVFYAFCIVASWYVVFEIHADLPKETQASSGTLAILGDSLATGAGSHPDLRYDTEYFVELLMGQKSLSPLNSLSTGSPSDIPAHKRHGSSTLDDQKASIAAMVPQIWHSNGPFSWAAHMLNFIFSQANLNTLELSWGNQLRKNLGIPVEQMLVAANNGARMAAAPAQLKKAFRTNNSKIPEIIAILFTGNDLCSFDYASLKALSLEYGEGLRNTLQFAIDQKNQAAERTTTTIFIGQFLTITQLFQSESILTSKKRVFKQELTCKDLQQAYYRPASDGGPTAGGWADGFSSVLPPNPASFCPTLFAYPLQNPNNLSIIANLVRDFREEVRQVVADLHKDLEANNIRVIIVEQTKDIAFSGQDFADDCFHLRESGHQKIAQAFYEAWRNED